MGTLEPMRTRLSRTALLLLLAGTAHAGAVTPAVAPSAGPFALGDVQLLDSPFKRAMERNAAYLLSLEPDRLLHSFRVDAGLAPKARSYGGWESSGLAGHTLGHYLTALSQQFAATGDERFRERINYIVSELALCQAAGRDGYVGALPPLELNTLRDLGKGIVELSGPHSFRGGAWAPWYTEHKVLNGLKDAWVLAGNTQARDVALGLADWTDAMTRNLTADQLQRMLEVEQGGMMDVLVELYARTGNPRYLETSRRFYHKAVFDPLLAHRDDLVGLHANTQIPKIIGEARTYEVTGDPDARSIATNFWELVAHHHSYVIGGDSEDEHFFDESTTSHHLRADTAETCNTYNMLKLTEHVFGWDPKVDYADFYERALYNHILASQDPDKGMFTYFMSLKPGFFKTYSTPFDSFWCCVGTGMENHTKYGEAIYFHGGDSLYVNLFIPSELTWREKGLVLEQRTEYPSSGKSVLTVLAPPTSKVTLRIRCPGWAAGNVTFRLNGAQLNDVAGTPGTYATLERGWGKGDRLEVDIPMAVRAEPMPDDPAMVAFLYGPVVLAADLGAAPSTVTAPYARDQHDNFLEAACEVPLLVRGSAPVESCLTRLAGAPLEFRTVGLGKPADLNLLPFWEISYDRYNVYWRVLTEDQWKAREAQPAPGS